MPSLAVAGGCDGAAGGVGQRDGHAAYDRLRSVGDAAEVFIVEDFAGDRRLHLGEVVTGQVGCDELDPTDRVRTDDAVDRDARGVGAPAVRRRGSLGDGVGAGVQVVEQVRAVRFGQR